MDVFADYLASIDDPQQRARTEEVLDWVTRTFPHLSTRIAWNQPMFTDHGTFIISFSATRRHLAVAPESAGIKHFSDEIVRSGYDHSKEYVRIPWTNPVDYALLEKMIAFNIADKADCSTFWRKREA